MGGGAVVVVGGRWEEEEEKQKTGHQLHLCDPPETAAGRFGQSH